jgi:hypothetical protein
VQLKHFYKQHTVYIIACPLFPDTNNGAAFVPESLVRKMARLSPCRFKMADKKNYKKPVKYKNVKYHGNNSLPLTKVNSKGELKH